MKRFLLFLCLVLMPTAATAQWNYASKAALDSLALALLKTSLGDSLVTDYGVRPRLNAKMVFNTYGLAGQDTLQAWKNSKKITVAYLDSLGELRVLNLYASNKITIPYVYLNASGRADYPAIRWLGIDEDTGIYRVGPNRFGITAKGANVATFDSSGVAVTGTVTADSLKITSALLWGPTIGSFVTVSTDSVVSNAIAADTTGTRTDWWQYWSWDSAESPSSKTGIFTTTFPITGTTNPDSLVGDFWFDGTAAAADSGSFLVIVKNHVTGVIVSSTIKTVAVTSTWEHWAVVVPTVFTRNYVYSMTVYCKARSGGRWCWSPPRFK